MPSREDPPNVDETDRRRRRARLLAELAEARALRERVAPRRTRIARARAAIRAHTFRN